MLVFSQNSMRLLLVLLVEQVFLEEEELCLEFLLEL